MGRYDSVQSGSQLLNSAVRVSMNYLNPPNIWKTSCNISACETVKSLRPSGTWTQPEKAAIRLQIPADYSQTCRFQTELQSLQRDSSSITKSFYIVVHSRTLWHQRLPKDDTSAIIVWFVGFRKYGRKYSLQKINTNIKQELLRWNILDFFVVKWKKCEKHFSLVFIGDIFVIEPVFKNNYSFVLFSSWKIYFYLFIFFVIVFSNRKADFGNDSLFYELTNEVKHLVQVPRLDCCFLFIFFPEQICCQWIFLDFVSLPTFWALFN